MPKVTMDAALLKERMEMSFGCCLNLKLGCSVAKLPDIAKVEVADARCGEWGRLRASYEDDESFAIFRGKDGLTWAFEEWSDSTGHGCQCAGTLHSFPTIDHALLLGLSRECRARACELLGREMPDPNKLYP